MQRGDPAGAERLIREAIATKPDVRLAHFNLALLAEQRGDVRQAEREYLEELKLHPDSYKAAFNLSRLYEQVGDREGQIGALKQSIYRAIRRLPKDTSSWPRRISTRESTLPRPSQLAQKGLELAPRSEYAPLGHYVLADIYNRQGRGSGGRAGSGAGARAGQSQAVGGQSGVRPGSDPGVTTAGKAAGLTPPGCAEAVGVRPGSDPNGWA